jgi:predicted nucleic acid-binding protein
MSDPTASAVRVVVDVNLLVRGILSGRGGSAVLIRALKQGRFIPVASRLYLQEIYNVDASLLKFTAERCGWSR